MHINLALEPIVALIAGIVILVVPRILNYVIALYLIIIGLAGVFGLPHITT
jgi:threonine/homoserine efflux transporter RhtA